MTPALLYSGARMAAKLALECKRDGEAFEALRHRERAAWYLQRRAMLKVEIIPEKQGMEKAA